jgi:regulatory protein
VLTLGCGRSARQGGLIFAMMAGHDNSAGRRQRKPRALSPAYLERVALAYLERFAASTASLKRVLANRIRRAADAGDPNAEQAVLWVQAVIEKMVRLGYVNDEAYARMKAASLHRRGLGRRRVAAELAQKGIGQEQVADAMAAVAEEQGVEDGAALERVAAWRFARRRRLGLYRPEAARAERRERDMAALARAGFSFDIVREVIEADKEPETL